MTMPDKNYELDSLYPHNLIAVLYGEKEPMTPEAIGMLLGAEGALEVAMALAALTDRERKVLMMRYRSGMSLDEVGSHFMVTRERIRQIENKAIRKLQCRKNSRELLKLGVTGWLRKKIEEHAMLMVAAEADTVSDSYETKCKNLPDIQIEEMDFGVKAYNCLRRGGVKTLHDICELGTSGLMGIRNLGPHTMDEIIQKVHEAGYKLCDE